MWATAYKVDGFRFDLMGHHMVANILKARDTLHALTAGRDGVDGAKIYLYGEGWDFGEVADNARGPNATQLNMAGSGIGTFNDRLRDAARGGGPFGDPQAQGFIDGLFSASNGAAQGSPEAQKALLLQYSDLIRLGLAGNLRDYRLIDRTGAERTGAQIAYNGQPAGYTLAPLENVVYVAAHDNETLFDAIQLKAPASAPLADRARMAGLGLSLVALSQGAPFFHAGDELLRSKSLDRNSYNSGDWFNRLDWTYRTNNWGVGLPPEGENRDRWPIARPLLADAALKPTRAEIASSLARFEELLRIRKSSRLFRLETADQIERQLTFFNTGPDQIPGLIMMRLTGAGPDSADAYGQIFVLFNATSQEVGYTNEALKGLDLALHPVQAASSDPAMKAAVYWPHLGMFCVPAYSTAVFVGAAPAQAPAQPMAAPQPAAASAPTAAATSAPAAAPAATTTSAVPTVASAPAAAPATTGAGANGMPGGLIAVIAAIAAVLAGALIYFRRRG
jgi:pullulanase-type alpha-1,6-glucosidase